jgi:16S rRNA (guanine966-N2)-methyltransferase
MAGSRGSQAGRRRLPLRRTRGGSLRVTGGELRGRRLRTPGAGVRPSADRVRESLFARLGSLEGARVLDLYAGSGALGIEALSRGAPCAVFVERSPRSLAVLRGNLASLGLQGRARVVAGDATRCVRRLAQGGERFDLVLLDPPYASGEAPRALAALRDAGILAPGATLVIESGRRHPVPHVEGFAARDERRYGDTLITRLAPEAPGGPGRG